MRNILIVGASSGIGRQLASQLSSTDYHVFGTYNEHPHSDDAHITYHHLNVLEEGLDLSFLPDRLDGLVYCPGSINLKPFHKIKPQQFLDDVNLQVVGAIKVIQSVQGLLKKGTHPSIVLFSTVAVSNGFNFHSQVAVSKGAIEGLTRSLAAEFAPSIRVNAIAPSLTNTPLAARLINSEQKIEANAARHPLARIGETTDIANTVEFLISEKSTWITGQILHVDGGMSSIKL